MPESLSGHSAHGLDQELPRTSVTKTLRAENERLKAEVERLTEENRSLRVEYHAAAALLREAEGAGWVRGANPTFGNELRRRLADG